MLNIEEKIRANRAGQSGRPIWRPIWRLIKFSPIVRTARSPMARCLLLTECAPTATLDLGAGRGL